MKKNKNVYYDKKADALWIRMESGTEIDSEEIAPGVSIEYNNKGGIIGVEVLRASRLFSTLRNNHAPQKHQFAA